MNDAPQVKAEPMKGREEFEAIFGKQTPQIMKVLEPHLDALLNGELRQLDLQICRGLKMGDLMVKVTPIPEDAPL